MWGLIYRLSEERTLCKKDCWQVARPTAARKSALAAGNPARVLIFAVGEGMVVFDQRFQTGFQNVGIYLGGRYIGMTQHLLYRPEVGTMRQ